MKRFLIVAAALALFSPKSTQAAFVPDGSFETNVIPTNSYAYNPASTTWAFAGNSGLINGVSSAFGNTTADANQVAFLQSNAAQGQGVQGNISESFSFTGGVYSIQFLAEKRGGSFAQPSFIVTIDGSTVGTFSPTTTSSYTSFITSNFTVGAGTHTLAFIATGPSDSTSFIDAVSLNAVPEPASIAMMGMGLVAAGAFASKKARRNSR